MEFEKLEYSHLKPLIEQKKISCLELTRYFLQRIEEGQALNAFISVLGERALEKAARVDQKLTSGKAGKLAGLVLGIKDILCLRGQKTTCGSKILENFVPPYDATVIERLEAEDAVIVGKTNMDEFAMGSSNENSYFGPVRNPHDSERVPGGSSGGSAAAVAAGLVTASLGTDTGGSIRQPAAFCGVVGLKPTYGRVSRFGLVAYASSLDQIGPITKSVEDAARLMEVIAGHDIRDSTSAQLPVPAYHEALKKDIKGLKIGLPREYFAQGLDPEIKSAIENVVTLLKENGAEIGEVSLPHTDYAIATYYILATAEASSNLARYDGTRYGYRVEKAQDLEDMYLKTRSLGFGQEVKRRIMLGTYVLSAGYYEAYYRKAQKVRTLIKCDFDQAFEIYDCLITPTTPTTAFKLGEKIDDPLTMYLSDIFTVSINLAGLPAISVPCGFDSRKLPIGLQIIGRPFDEEMVLRVAQGVENGLKN